MWQQFSTDLHETDAEFMPYAIYTLGNSDVNNAQAMKTTKLSHLSNT